MPADRGRASKACTACRKQKTRCYEPTIGRPCLRCDQLGLDCSLSAETLYSGSAQAEEQRVNNRGDANDKIARLERVVEDLAKRLSFAESEIADLQRHEKTPSKMTTNDSSQMDVEVEGGEEHPAPLFVLRDVTTQSGVQPTDRTSMNTTIRETSDDIITKGMVSEQEAHALLALFQENYGEWVYFDPGIPITQLLVQVRKSPLLLAACSLIAVRHMSQELASRLAPKLFQDAKALLSQAMLRVPQPIEFFQAALVLCMWSTTIGQLPLQMDSWLLSGFALQHSIASGLFTSAQDHRDTTLDRKALDNLCIWNHLCLVHLHYCVGTRRRSVLNEADIRRCKTILESNTTTNFESRMVAEVHLYWIMYHNCSTSVDLPKTQHSLHAWKEEWGWLFDQPRSQFVQMGYHFAQLLAYDQSLKTGSSAARESLLSEMVRLSTSIIDLAIVTADERTRHLTDHIYHMISFAAVSLCRLLSGYEKQLSRLHDLRKLDELILSLVSWLHAIGFPCHVAHTMGDVVAAFHKKLRPDLVTSPGISYAGIDSTIQDDFAQLFPEFYGASSFDLLGASMLPEFQPF